MQEDFKVGEVIVFTERLDRTAKITKRHEGYRESVYLCPSGKPTWGYGFNLEDSPHTSSEIQDLLSLARELADEPASKLIEDWAALVLERRLSLCVVFLDCIFWSVDLSDVRTAALADMTYNLGEAGFKKFKKMIAAINVGDFEAAAKEMLDSKWAQQVGQRAKTLAEMMRSDKWPDFI